MRRLLIRAGGLLILFVSIWVVPVPAGADPLPPSITSITCSPGHLQIGCAVLYGGGEGYIEIEWRSTKVDLSGFRNQSLVRFNCTVGEAYWVEVTVRDSWLNSDTQGAGTTCKDFSPPKIQELNCDSGSSRFICTVHYTGGQPPISIRWIANNVKRPIANDQTQMNICCQPGQLVTVKVGVADKNLDTDSATKTGRCNRIWPYGAASRVNATAAMTAAAERTFHIHE